MSKTKQLRSHRNFKKAQLDLKGNFPFSVLALYKHFRISDANRSTNDATSKHATQTETKTSKSQKFYKDATSKQMQNEAAQTGTLV